MTVCHRQTFKSLLFAATILASPLIAAGSTPASAQMAVGISVQIAPPMLPVYVQPPLPEVGFIWTPGYWAWSQPVGYYWVPGTWQLPPTVNVLWTPPYWSWLNGAYVFHEGYWGPHVGYYGGVNYGYGYGGRGYEGGRWESGGFVYNRGANNFGMVRVPHAYQQNVSAANNTHVSYAGGTGGLRSAPNAAELAAGHDNHVPPTAVQSSHITAAAQMPELAASNNHGHPVIAATPRPAQFHGPGVVAAKPEQAAAHPAAPASPHPVASGQGRPAEVHAAVPALRPAPVHETAAPRAAQQQAEHAAPSPHPVAAATARPGEVHAAAAPAPGPAAAHEAPAPRPAPVGKNEEKKPGA